jgi:hypothetical protein
MKRNENRLLIKFGNHFEANASGNIAVTLVFIIVVLIGIFGFSFIQRRHGPRLVTFQYALLQDLALLSYLLTRTISPRSVFVSKKMRDSHCFLAVLIDV